MKVRDAQKPCPACGSQLLVVTYDEGEAEACSRSTCAYVDDGGNEIEEFLDEAFIEDTFGVDA